MKKKLIIFCTIILVVLSITTNAEKIIIENKTPGFTIISGTNNSYVVSGCSYINDDGVVFVPIKSFFDALGYKNEKYYIEINESDIQIFRNGTIINLPIGTEFTYSKNGTQSKGLIIKYNNELYIRLDVISNIVDGKFIVNKNSYAVFANDNNNLKYYFNDVCLDNAVQNIISQKTFANCNVNQYVTSKFENKRVKGVNDICRMWGFVYYLSGGKVYRFLENEEINNAKVIDFIDQNNKKINLSVYRIISADGYIFGITLENGKPGRLFRTFSDGSNFEYITDYNVSSMQYKKSESSSIMTKNIFFESVNGKVYVYNLFENECYEMHVVDMDNNEFFKKSQKRVFTKNGFAFINDSNKSITVALSDEIIGRSEWIKIWDEDKLNILESDEHNYSFSNISAINASTEKNMIYFSDNLDNGKCKIYCYDIVNKKLSAIKEINHSVDKISLFEASNDGLIINAEGDNKSTLINI